MQATLDAQQLTKYYSAVAAIRDVSFTPEPGTIFGLLGPNGSGKSTTVSLLTGLREPSAGQICFNGSTSPTVSSSTKPVSATCRRRRTSMASCLAGNISNWSDACAESRGLF